MMKRIGELHLPAFSEKGTPHVHVIEVVIALCRKLYAQHDKTGALDAIPSNNETLVLVKSQLTRIYPDLRKQKKYSAVQAMCAIKLQAKWRMIKKRKEFERRKLEAEQGVHQESKTEEVSKIDSKFGLRRIFSHQPTSNTTNTKNAKTRTSPALSVGNDSRGSERGGGAAGQGDPFPEPDQTTRRNSISSSEFFDATARSRVSSSAHSSFKTFSQPLQNLELIDKENKEEWEEEQEEAQVEQKQQQLSAAAKATDHEEGSTGTSQSTGTSTATYTPSADEIV